LAKKLESSSSAGKLESYGDKMLGLLKQDTINKLVKRMPQFVKMNIKIKGFF